MKINRHVCTLIRCADDPLGRQFLPDPRELNDSGGDIDPLDEERQSPTPQVVHRYPHRVIFLVSNRCAVTCRFCMRKRIVGDGRRVTAGAIDAGLDYIRGNRQVNEVILSGGDPLMLADQRLSEILGAIKAVEHVRVVRVHSRIPSVWPRRITEKLARRLASFRPLYLNIHVNHPAEITRDTARACARLADAGIPLGSQTVLLAGVNDHPDTLYDLFTRLLEIRVRPYYLHQLDRVSGTAHFRVPLERGLHLMDALRGRLSGMAMPHYMIDLPGGGGKVELLPDAIMERRAGGYSMKNFQGRTFPYPSE
jgi:lysine 2,3-aminomutase